MTRAWSQFRMMLRDERTGDFHVEDVVDPKTMKFPKTIDEAALYVARWNAIAKDKGYEYDYRLLPEMGSRGPLPSRNKFQTTFEFEEYYGYEDIEI